jgi:chemotaxis protein MotB
MVAMVVSSCGYSEDEWQAQLAKYNRLAQQYQDGENERARLQTTLDKAELRVQQLSRELERMGVDLDELNTRLEQAGTEKQQLTSNVEELELALREFQRRAEILERIKKRFVALRRKLKRLTRLGLKVEIRNNRMVIRLPGDVLFASGKDKLQKKGIEVLDRVAHVIGSDRQLRKRYYQVAGHTDTKPLQGGRFGDNWGLSVMRARRVLLYLIAPTDSKGGGGGLNPARLHAAGYGETDPVAPNSTDEGRAQNRRVELVILPDVEEMLNLRELL